jgi:hypothetical protein
MWGDYFLLEGLSKVLGRQGDKKTRGQGDKEREGMGSGE